MERSIARTAPATALSTRHQPGRPITVLLPTFAAGAACGTGVAPHNPAMPHVLVAGLGLMGSSLAWRLHQLGWDVWLHHRRPEVSAEAAKRGWGRVVTELSELPAELDVAVVGVPVSAVTQQVRTIAAAHPSCVITDVGSTKASICADLSDLASRFVGAHPMCGSHRSGLANADPDLYAGARCIVTPVDATPEPAVHSVSELWQAVGCDVVRMCPKEHDISLARASHLPHVLAALAARQTDAAAAKIAATGYRDTTRVAAGSPALWADIALANQDALSTLLSDCQRDLAAFSDALAAEDHDALQAWFAGGRDGRALFDAANEISH